ncbi:phosphonate ABC transporter, permease protein PhnE [Rivularia sp. UHCC 0363]|uniref:phosphonate ABC transporter, permease protein PhnE n=1 Tax=Rivularia sp. UHCC 0363 TaxID=3110244 RepID=UPI002B1FF342|nr:phosphonate ABC transporter, permease protein PhnE [Rivularia sp. UHCC 0363]MEA5592884.1 phosphonate ABC transporter, permease protein PhnE [Rivularia sp. UHCC 0363]
MKQHKSNFQNINNPAVAAMLEQEAKLVTNTRIVYLIVIILILFLSALQSEINFLLFLKPERISRIANYIPQYFPPDFTDWKTYLEDTLITISMGIWGTLLAAIAAIPLSIFASNNIFPSVVVQPTRRLLDAMRAINELVFALIFIVAVGLGPFAGVLALFLHTAGTLGKLFSETVEAIEPAPVEGIRATGASKIQEIIYGVIPQVIPLWTSFTLYRFEANVRSASVLGIVGAGGIGFSLYQSFGSFEYQKVCAILIILIVATSLIDLASAKIRSWLV